MYKVLVVEDEVPIRKGIIYTYAWQESGCIVVGEAGNGLEGIEKIMALKPDIVITDIGMPVLNGLEMLSETAADYVYSSIIISVYEEFEKARQALNIGVSSYLQKPLVHEQLTAALKKAITDLIYKQSYHRQRETTQNLDLLSTVADLLKPAEDYQNYYVRKIQAYVKENYQKRINLQDLEQELGVSATYINKNLRAETNQTFNEYLNRYRIQKAVEILKHGESRIYHVAEAVGYRDYKYFITVFKKYVGGSPSKLMAFYKRQDANSRPD